MNRQGLRQWLCYLYWKWAKWWVLLKYPTLWSVKDTTFRWFSNYTRNNWQKFGKLHSSFCRLIRNLNYLCYEPTRFTSMVMLFVLEMGKMVGVTKIPYFKECKRYHFWVILKLYQELLAKIWHAPWQILPVNTESKLSVLWTDKVYINGYVICIGNGQNGWCY